MEKDNLKNEQQCAIHDVSERFVKGKIEEIETYRDYKIVIEHNLNIFENVKDNEFPIYTICGMGRCYQGELNDVKKFMDTMFIKYSDA
jgi:metal-sulfur cluster biosynthetic enzyme